MNPRMKVGTVRGWDIGLAAVIVAVVFFGWLTAPGSNGAAPHSRKFAGPARLSGRAGPGGDVVGSFCVAPRPRGGNGGATGPGLTTGVLVTAQCRWP
jgi:hypothetical protein